MIAYHRNKELKRSIIAELEAHRAADRLVKGRYWENGKGCAVGCTIKSGNHSLYESKFGIPQSLARLEDAIFEGLPNQLAQHWPVRFMSSINVGADLSLVQWHILTWIVQRANPDPDAVVQRVLDGLAMLASGLPWPDANAAAADAAYVYASSSDVSSYTASSYAASSAAASAAASSAASSAAAFAKAADVAADAAASASSASASASSAAARCAAREKYWSDLADQLVRLIGECN